MREGESLGDETPLRGSSGKQRRALRKEVVEYEHEEGELVVSVSEDDGSSCYNSAVGYLSKSRSEASEGDVDTFAYSVSPTFSEDVFRSQVFRDPNASFEEHGERKAGKDARARGFRQKRRPRCCGSERLLSCRFLFLLLSLTLVALVVSYTTVLLNRRAKRAAAPAPAPPPPDTRANEDSEDDEDSIVLSIPLPNAVDRDREYDNFTPRMRAIADQLAEATTKDTLMHTHSPQHQALLWLTHHDTRQLRPSHPDLLQRYALATLYFAADGYNWNAPQPTQATALQRSIPNTNWLTPLHECQWMFVHCIDTLDRSETHNRNLRNLRTPADKHDAFGDPMANVDLGFLAQGRVVGLHLDAKHLLGSMPDEIGVLDSLETLDVSSNSLHGTIPITLASIKELQTLRLSGNQFNGTIPEALGSLSKLVELRLEDNPNLTGAVPQEVCELSEFSSLLTFPPPQFSFPSHLDCSCCQKAGNNATNVTQIVVTLEEGSTLEPEEDSYTEQPEPEEDASTLPASTLVTTVVANGTDGKGG